MSFSKIQHKSTFPINEFEKIEDIIYYDEPILTHYKRGDKDYLFYLVDTTETLDILLIIEVDEKIIFNYLIGKITLRDIIVSADNFIYEIKIDFTGEVLGYEIKSGKSIQDNYLPEMDSFLNYAPTNNSYYFDFIEKYNNQAYLEKLKESAFYIKFNSKDKKFANTIGFNELVDVFLRNVLSSYNNFLYEDFYNKFKEELTNQTKLKQLFRKTLPYLEYRMVDLNIGSFEIGLSTDKVMKTNIENPAIKDWSLQVSDKFKNVVLDTDYDKKTVDEIIESFTPEQRKKIFNPIFNITENPNHSISVKDSKEDVYEVIRIENKNVIDRIVPKEIEKKEEKEEYEIMQITKVVKKNEKRTTIRLDNNTLFSSAEQTKILLSYKDFLKHGYEVVKAIQIPVLMSTQEDKLVLNAEYDNNTFEAVCGNSKLDEGVDMITKKIFEYIVNQK